MSNSVRAGLAIFKRKAISLTRLILSQPPIDNEPVHGFVEFKSYKTLSGWAVDQREYESAQFSFVLGSEKWSNDNDINWFCREDVIAAFAGQENASHGFELSLPQEIKKRVLQKPSCLSELKCYFNGHLLSCSETIELASVPHFEPNFSEQKSQKKPLGSVSLDAREVTFTLDRLDSFTIFIETSSAINSDKLDCRLASKSLDIKATPSLSDKESPTNSGSCYWQMEIPGYVWSMLKEQKELNFELFYQDVCLGQFDVSHTLLLNWLTEVALVKTDAHSQLLALEHLHYIGKLDNLSDIIISELSDIAKSYNLHDYLPEKEKVKKNLFIDNSPRNVLWMVMKVFNQQWPEYQGREGLLLKKVIADYNLSDENTLALVKAVTPCFCKHRCFSILLPYFKSSDLDKAWKLNNAWELSLILPLALHYQTADEFIHFFIKLEESKGWLNTECIEYVATTLMNSAKAMPIDEKDRFIYAFLSFLDKLSISYWSRLHDEHLINAYICCLSSGECLSYWTKKDLALAGIRHFALTERFWRKLSAAKVDTQLLAIFALAKKSYENIYRILPNRSLWLSEQTQLFSALDYFLTHNNLIASQAMREVVLNMLEFDNELDLDLLKHKLSILNVRDRLRLTASPLLACSKHNSRLSIGEKHIVSEASSYKYRSPRLDFQQLAYDKLQGLKKQVSSQTIDETMIKSAFSLVDELSDKSISYIGLDCLVQLITAFCQQSVASASSNSEACLLLCERIHRFIDDIDFSKEYVNNLAVLVNALFSLNKILKSQVCKDNALLISNELNYIQSKLPISNLDQLLEQHKQAPNQVNDTIVIIYSCRAYLNDRVSAIRETWIKDLQSHNISYLIVVGDGDDSIVGDVLSLNVADKYEDLPQKTLKLFDWLYHNTDYQYVVKIDDDCLLDVAEYFSSMSHRKTHYYGRELVRHKGYLDRTWHQNKSTRESARFSLDKSPEPSTYADGGSAYCLSRFAISKLLKAANSSEGKQLASSSFMEDKLVGDLLALEKVWLSSEDCFVHVRRRLFADAQPVSIYENNFYPSKSSNTKLVHLDSAKDMGFAYQHLKSDSLYPKKIWPSINVPSLGYDKNQLELLSVAESIPRLLDTSVVVVAVMYNEMIMLPHFLAHYRQLGVECFIIADNTSTDGSREYLLEQDDVILYSADTQYKKSHFGVSWQQAILANHCLAKWSLVVDADELLIYPDFENTTLADYVTSLDEEGADCALIHMLDFYPKGRLEDANFKQGKPFELAAYYDKDPLLQWHIGSGQFSDAPSNLSSLRHRLSKNSQPTAFTSQKYALFKYMPWMRLSEGLHYLTNIKVAEKPIAFAHFKYHAGFKEKVEHEIKRKQHFNNADEYQKYLELLSESQGGFYEDGVSTKFTTSKNYFC